MTNIGQTAVFAFTVFNAVRVFSYIPQMLKIWRDRHGSEAVSITTWALFGLSHLSTVMYAIVVPCDYYMAAIFTANAVCCGFIVGLTRWSRLNRVRSVELRAAPSGNTAGPTRKAADQPLFAVGTGWLLAVVLAFVVVHVFAGSIQSPAVANEITSPGLEAIQSLYD